MVKKEYYLKGLGCANCAVKIEEKIGKLQGVTDVSVSFATAIMTVHFENDAGDMRAAIEKIVKSVESHVEMIDKEKRTGLETVQKPILKTINVKKSEGSDECGGECAGDACVRANDVSDANDASANACVSDCADAYVSDMGSRVGGTDACAGACASDASACAGHADDDACVCADKASVYAGDAGDAGAFVDECVDKCKDKSENACQEECCNSSKSLFPFFKLSFFRHMNKKQAGRLLIGFVFYFIGILIHLSHTDGVTFISDIGIEHASWVEWGMFGIAYFIIGGDVVYKAVRGILRREFFDENFLMTIATLGAFVLGEYTEAVAVMLFYKVGEMFQEIAVGRSRKSIYDMMDIRPDYAHRVHNSGYETVSPYDVAIGDSILVKPGEKIPLDGTVLSGSSLMDTSALTGESVPKTVREGDVVLSGSINKSGTLTIRVDQLFEESTVSKILDLVENAASKKAPTEKFITKFSKYYTPLVTTAAVLIAIVPPLVLPGASFEDWIYRGLVFLVISCPCALVISVPLSYFGGIGAASKKGVLFKGGNYLEGLTHVKTVVFDKTGTLSEGVFDVVRIDRAADSRFSDKELLYYSAAAESFSNHPIAHSIVKAGKGAGFSFDKNKAGEHNEYSGLGVKAVYGGQNIVVGNLKFMASENISVSDFSEADAVETHIYVAVGGVFEGRIAISDKVKANSKDTLKRLKKAGIEKTVMLTGDIDKVGRAFAFDLGLDDVYTEQLPHQKVEVFEKIESDTKKKNPKAKVAFVGDGINDAPVLTRADIGIAVGGVGSDAAIEAADIVLMTGDPKQLADAFDVAQKTKTIVYQNIFFALGIKFIFMALGVFGIASMWEAVFADVGVTLIAVLNSMRLLRLK